MNFVQFLSHLKNDSVPVLPNGTMARLLAAIQTITDRCVLNAKKGECPIIGIPLSDYESQVAASSEVGFLLDSLNFLGVNKDNTSTKIIEDGGIKYLTVILSW